jgi:DNA repair ATPase RecN
MAGCVTSKAISPSLSSERIRIAGALEEAKERHEHEVTTQRMRFDALQARAAASEKLLGEAREHLLGRADEIRTADRRAGELALERDALQTRIADLEKERIQRESEFKEVDHARATLMERSGCPHPRLYRQGGSADTC